jgi:F-type H+-transporting ATPase subunit delta
MSSTEQVQVRHTTVLDDEARQVARVYAEALFQAAQRGGQQEEVLHELGALVDDAFRQKPGLELFLASPAVGRDRKAKALRAAFEGRATPVFVHFLLVLNHHDRLGYLQAIAGAYRALHERRSNRIRVVVRSAVPLTDEERGRVWHDVRDVSGREPVLEEAVDPELLGGLVIRVGDWVYDASVRTRLESIRDRLIERSSDDIQRWRDRFSS